MIYTAQQLTNMQQFSIQECYKKLTGENEKVNWSKFVWNRLTLPKHRFICWLVMKERLNIALRLRNMGITDDPLCRLCGIEDETHLHLFFNCPFSLEVCKSISKWMQFELFGDSIDSSCRKVLTSRRSRFQKQSLLAVLGAAIYFIWLARNDAVWNSKIDIIRHNVHRIQKVCVIRYGALEIGAVPGIKYMHGELNGSLRRHNLTWKHIRKLIRNRYILNL
ncbi:uncharacterized protein LOC125493801 [Beta vulgaris subsp. vulgaris]|uniref:uncharacterized protein LOC125493801 n=1 Tax=Beta vulgaris subsp. vulgaris TaxID=3555 RepID=UPI002036867A|nr:uncharacterized protein LOC125493801 [Beta vulgaris subsp. vulgaris]